ncbi:nucleotidyltransferase substrate binding protein [Candidatus Gottesmanbacteria bacterium]|nr:nucleotidyltransferase substrate binding protein [Candidatus Gottesmanbacteria bacterium]
MTYVARFTELKTAFIRLKEAIPEVKNQLEKDGAIQRFEFVFELVWKTLKDYAEDKGRFDAASPKDAFRVAADLGLVDNPLLWFDFLKSRNEATHLYDEQKVQDVFLKIPNFIDAVENLISKISKGFASK